MYALLAVAAKGEGTEQQHLDGLIKDKAINSFSPKEQTIIQANELDDLTAAVTLRSTDEVLDILDIVYRMHWAVVDARINQQQVGGGIEPSIVYERHYALNWLIRDMDCDWDDVQTNT